MRNRWEDKGGGDDLDTPVTLTESKLRSLERGAKLGMFGLILAFLAAGAAGYAMFRTLQAPAPVPVAEAASTPAPTPVAAPDTGAAQPASTAPAGAPTATAAPAPTAGSSEVAAAPVEKHTVKAVNASSRSRRVGRQSHGAARYTGGPAPKMENFDPGPAKPAPAPATSTPAPSPVPVPVAAPDTTH